MLTLLNEIAIFDPDNPATIAKLTNIMEGVDGSSAFGYSVETEALAVEDNQKQQYIETHTLDIRVVEETAETDKLLAFVANGTKVKIAGYGPQAILIWDEPVTISINKQYDNVLSLAVVATLRKTIGYPESGGKSAIVGSDNMLDLYDMQNVLETDIESKLFFFPFAGVSLQSNAVTGNSQITAYASNGVTIQGQTPDSTVPRTLLLPADTVYIRVTYGTFDSTASLKIV